MRPHQFVAFFPELGSRIKNQNWALVVSADQAPSQLADRIWNFSRIFSESAAQADAASATPPRSGCAGLCAPRRGFQPALPQHPNDGDSMYEPVPLGGVAA